LGTSLAAHVDGTVSTKALAQLLFGKYVFAFEAMGVLLLIIAIGAVALSRIEGGTHADE
jgi:NADH-quinone oxidoreductase subunit J